MAEKKKKTAKAKKDASEKKKRERRWARNAKEAAEEARERNKGKNAKLSNQDKHMLTHPTRRKRIRDIGQAVPDGYLRQRGGLYFVHKDNVRVGNKESAEKKAFVAGRREQFFGKDGGKGWMDSAANQGQWDGETGEMNFRKTRGAYTEIAQYKKRNEGSFPGAKDAHGRAKSSAIILFGVDGRTD